MKAKSSTGEGRNSTNVDGNSSGQLGNNAAIAGVSMSTTSITTKEPAPPDASNTTELVPPSVNIKTEQFPSTLKTTTESSEYKIPLICTELSDDLRHGYGIHWKEKVRSNI